MLEMHRRAMTAAKIEEEQDDFDRRTSDPALDVKCSVL